MQQTVRRLSLLSLLTLVGAGCGGEASRKAPEAPAIAVRAATAHVEPLPTIYRASGTIRGRSTAILTSKITGFVRTVLVRPGDSVTSGQLLAELEANDVRASVSRARASLSQAVAERAGAETAIEAASAAATLAKNTHERVTQLFDQRAVSQQTYDEQEERLHSALAHERMARAQLSAVSSSIEEAKAALAESQAMLAYSKIVAPFAGRVLERRIDPGALASPGTPLLVLADEGTVRVEAAVEESRTPALGDEASIEIEAIDRAVTGKVSEIVPSVDVASRAFVVKVDLPSGLPSLRPGTFARVGFRVGSRPRLVVPTGALDELGSLQRVFVVENGSARLRMITRGDAQGPWTEVLSGLGAGERVVLDPPANLHDGSRVQVAP